MRVADVMKPNVTGIVSRSTVCEAERVMREQGISHLPVVDDGVLLGLVSARDLARAWRSPVNSTVPKRVQEIMSQPVIVVEPTRSLDDAVRLMRAEAISALPVTQAGRLVGLLTEDDVLALFLATARAIAPSSRVEVTVPTSPSGLAGVIRAIEQVGIPIAQLTTITGRDGHRRAIVDLGTIDPRRAVTALKAEGYVLADCWTREAGSEAVAAVLSSASV